MEGIDYNAGDHAGGVLFAREETSHEKDDDRDWYCRDGEIKFDVIMVDYDDDELDSKAEEEEEIELQ